VVAPLAALLTRGDVHGLTRVRSRTGLPLIARVFAQQVPKHGRQWWRHLRSATGPSPRPAPAAPPARPVSAGDAVTLTDGETARFRAWRAEHCPGVSIAGLMASATYRALVAEDLPINGEGFHTLVDLRRHLPADQALRPGNIVKSSFIRVDLADPHAVAAGLTELVSSARAVPALLQGVLGSVIRPRSASPTATGPVTLTFNAMMRLPFIDRIPWRDPADTDYLTISYPASPDRISVSAYAVGPRLVVAASYDAQTLDPLRVRRALEAMRDIPALLTNGVPGRPTPPASGEPVLALPSDRRH
jgi:hypothetical protein